MSQRILWALGFTRLICTGMLTIVILGHVLNASEGRAQSTQNDVSDSYSARIVGQSATLIKSLKVSRGRIPTPYNELLKPILNIYIYIYIYMEQNAKIFKMNLLFILNAYGAEHQDG